MSSNATRRTTRATTRATQRKRGGKKGLRSPAVIACLIIIVGFVLIFGGYSITQEMQRKAEQEAALRRQRELEKQLKAKTTYVVAKVNIEIGDEITFTNIEAKEFPKDTKVVNGFQDTAAMGLIGSFATTDISSGQFILGNHLQESAVDVKLPPTDDEIEIKLSVPITSLKPYYMKTGNNVSVYSLLNTISGNRITKQISHSGRILFIKKIHITKESKAKEFIQNAASKDSAPMPLFSDIILGLKADEAKIITYELENNREIKFLPEGEDAPRSTAAILQVWTGVEMEEKEVPNTIGGTIAQGLGSEGGGSDNPEYEDRWKYDN